MTPALTETVAAVEPETVEPPVADEDVLAEVLVEEISIDGMCGVY